MFPSLFLLCAQCLFVHDCKILITSCSINQDHSILAYVVKETQPASPLGEEDAGASSSATTSQQVQGSWTNCFQH